MLLPSLPHRWLLPLLVQLCTLIMVSMLWELELTAQYLQTWTFPSLSRAKELE